MERSESGQPIYRHNDPKKPFELAIGDSARIEDISKHIVRHVGPIETVYHELISNLVHIDIHIVAPSPQRNCYTLVTSGMSDRPMNVPKEVQAPTQVELMMCLPATWKLDEPSLKDPANYWPIHMLKAVARMPHEYDTWVGPGHTIPNGDPAEPFVDSTALCCAVVLPPITVPEAFWQLTIDANTTIHFYSLWFLHRDELNLKLRKGIEALMPGFERNQVTELLDPARPTSIRKKRWWFPFG